MYHQFDNQLHGLWPEIATVQLSDNDAGDDDSRVVSDDVGSGRGADKMRQARWVLHARSLV